MNALPRCLRLLLCAISLAACEGTVVELQGRDAQGVARDSETASSADASEPARDGGPRADAASPVDGSVPAGPDASHPEPPDAAAPGLDACAPQCASGLSCGLPDGCGAKCRGCTGAGEVCDTRSWSCARPCVANCTGKSCGDGDGCGGRCTACPTPSQICNTGSWTCTACSLDCGGHGACFVENGQEACDCEDGYCHRLSTAGCEPAAGTACEGVTCSGHGTCLTSLFGDTSCHCDPGYFAYLGTCSPEDRWG